MSTSLANKSELLWSGLTERLELPEEAKAVVFEVAREFLTSEIKYVTLPAPTPVSTSTSASASASVVTKSKQTGYNVYIKTENARLKASIPDAKVRMAGLIADWKGFSGEQKDEWNAKVAGYTPASAKAVRPLKPYQQFVKDNHRKFQAQGLESTQCMVEIGKLWQSQKVASKVAEPAEPAEPLTEAKSTLKIGLKTQPVA